MSSFKVSKAVVSDDSSHRDSFIDEKLQPPPTRHRLLWLDAAKGFGILLVLLVHSRYGVYTANHPDSLLTLIIKAMINYTPCFMPLFFLLSGYTFKHRDGALKSRFLTLMRPYFTWVSVCIIFTILLRICLKGLPDINYISKLVSGAMYARFSLFPRGVEDNMTLFPSGGTPLWFLPCLFTAYALFIALIQLPKIKRIALSFVYMAIGFLLSFSPILLPWSIDTAFFGALFIYVGYIAKNRGVFESKLVLSVLIIVALYPLYRYTCKYNGAINMSVREFGKHAVYSPFLFVVNGLLGSYIICQMCRLIEWAKLSYPFVKLGQISLLILCSHSLFYVFIDNLVKWNKWEASVLWLGNYLFLVKIIVAIALAFLLNGIKAAWRSCQT